MWTKSIQLRIYNACVYVHNSVKMFLQFVVLLGMCVGLLLHRLSSTAALFDPKLNT